jgi:alkyl sulfatase BDS1-like metallo-beta-lactamase superfamily hydrolase
MPFYTDAQQIYEVMQALFEAMRDMDPNPVDALVSTHMIIRLNLTDPDAHITINGRQRPVKIDYGPANERADMEIGMTAEILHLVLLDEYSIKQGFSNGELKVRGPIWKALSFADIFQQGRTYYPQVLQDQGLG